MDVTTYDKYLCSQLSFMLTLKYGERLVKPFLTKLIIVSLFINIEKHCPNKHRIEQSFITDI